MLTQATTHHTTRSALKKSTQSTCWTEAWLRRELAVLRHAVLSPEAIRTEKAGRQLADAENTLIRLSQQPEMLAALRGRRDPAEAVRDLATRCAFEALMVRGQPFHQLDPLSQALVQSTLDDLHERAEDAAQRLGENPLDADDRLLVEICQSLASYVPRKPMGGHIAFKLSRPESAASRAMRQIEHLVEDSRVQEAFVAFVLDARLCPEVLERLQKVSADDHAADRFRARLVLLARGGGFKGLDWEATIRFFAQPETVAFVKRFAATYRPARTLYAEEEYGDVAWQGKRLPADRRQGYLEAALAQVQRPHDRSLDVREHADGHDGEDTHELGWHEQLAAPPDRTDLDGHNGRCFEAWAVDVALDHAPGDPIWQAGELVFGQGLAPELVLSQGRADRGTLTALQLRLAALRADPTVWQAWQEVCEEQAGAKG